MASFQKTTTRAGTTRWQSRWREPGPGGTQIARKANHGTEREARAHARLMERERERGGVGDPTKQTFGAFLTSWLDHLESRGDHAPTTISGYRRLAEAVSHHAGHIPLERLSPLDLDRLYATLLKEGGSPRKDGTPARPLARRTVLHAHRLCHTSLRQAQKWRLIAGNPAADASPPTVAFKAQRGFTQDEISRLLAAAGDDPTGYCVMALLLVTGMRRSELLGLAVEAIDWEASTLSIWRTVTEVKGKAVVREVPKSASSRRTIAVPATVMTLLREQKARVAAAALVWGADYQRSPMWLFPGLGGGPMDPMSMTLRLRQYCRRAKISGVAPAHGWRHSAATLMVSQGLDVKTVQGRLGHSTPTITLALYCDVIDERDRAAGEALATYLPAANAG